VDWPGVKASNVSFTFIKAADIDHGSLFVESTFAANWSGAKANGLLRGAYYFFHFDHDPVAQANFFADLLTPDRGELPPVVDVEDVISSRISVDDLNTFLDALQSRLGVKPIIYTGQWYWNVNRFGQAVAWANQYDLWCANNSATPAPPTDWQTWKFWQYSNTGSVAGMSPVDLDYFNGTLTDLAAYTTMVRTT